MRRPDAQGRWVLLVLTNRPAMQNLSLFHHATKIEPAMTSPTDPSTRAPASDEIVVFDNLRESTCSECGTRIGRGELLRVESDKALCLECADLAHLTFLPRGDAALTRQRRVGSGVGQVVSRFRRLRDRAWPHGPAKNAVRWPHEAANWRSLPDATCRTAIVALPVTALRGSEPPKDDAHA